MAVFVDSFVGVILQELLRVILEAKKKATKHKDILSSMETTLMSIKPEVEKMAALKERLDSGDDDEMKKLWNIVKDGKVVVDKCTKGKGPCSCFGKTDYTEELQELDRSLTRFCQIEIPIRQRVTQLKMAEKVDDISDCVRNIDQHVEKVHDVLEDNRKVLHVIERKLDDRNGSALSLSTCDPPDPPKLVVGLDMELSELKEEVLKKGMSVLVISALGGCGKTTLAKILCHDKDVKGKFKDNILFVSVSRTPNLMLIIKKLLQHKRHKVSETEFTTDESAKHLLERLLKELGKEPILLVLDDVWNGSESLIDSFVKPQLSDYKIVVTSRTIFPRFDSSTIKLKKLTEKDSMRLFRDAACLEDESPDINTDIVIQVVRACKGFPLALTVVGTSLCRQLPAFWKKRLMEWSKGSSIFEDHPELVNCMKTSLDALDNKSKLKEFYLDLGSFSEGESIPAVTLIDIWTELNEMKKNDTEFIGSIHELSAMNLLDFENGSKNTSESTYDDLFVTQHDLLRELVNHFNRKDPVEQRKRLIIEIHRDEFPQWWVEQEKSPSSALLMSVTTDESFSLNWISMQAPKVKVLVLNFLGKEYVLPEFATSMTKLKVLVVKRFGVSSAKIRNWSLLNKLSSLKKITLAQVLVTSLTLDTVQLENLRKIFFYKCDFDQSSTAKNIRTSDVFPFLREINISHSSNLVELPDGVCDIHHLKKLSITHCHGLSLLPKEITNLSNLEELRLCSCTSLRELPETIKSLHRLRILDISGCKSIEKLPEQISELQSLGKLDMTGCSRCKLSESVGNLMNSRKVICDEETTRLWESRVKSLPNMKLEEVE